MSDEQSSIAVYLVIENAYGAVKYPDSIWWDEHGAIGRAKELADGAEYKLRGDAYSMEGLAKKSASAFEVHKREVQ